MTRDIKRAKIYDPLRDPVPSSLTDDTRGFIFGTTSIRRLHPCRPEATEMLNLFRAFAGRQYQTRTRVLQNMLSSAHGVE